MSPGINGQNSTNNFNGTLSKSERKLFVSELRKILGFNPGNISIYEKAFIHRSATLLLENGKKVNNERLEFLGDAVLDAILSEILFERYPNADEGDLTKIRSRLVNRSALNSLALSMNLDKLIVSHVSKSTGGYNIYGDALEALMGSIFLDRGYKRTRKFITRKIIGKHLNLEEIVHTEQDYKSQVFQWAQKLNKEISFNHAEQYDPKSKKSIFTTILLIDHEIFGEGNGKSKKSAEQEASLNALKKIRKIGFID